MDSAGTPILSIGAVVDSDAESTAWKVAINALGKQIMALREGIVSPLRVNVVFHVDNRFTPNQFEGVRTGRFDKGDAHLMVQAAVPLAPAGDRRAVLLGLLAEAIDEAEVFAQKRRVADHLSEIRALVARLNQEA